MIIKDGFDTLKAQLLKREKRKFVIGFFSEKTAKHDIHVIFNEMPIKGSKKLLFFIFIRFQVINPLFSSGRIFQGFPFTDKILTH